MQTSYVHRPLQNCQADFGCSRTRGGHHRQNGIRSGVELEGGKAEVECQKSESGHLIVVDGTSDRLAVKEGTAEKSDDDVGEEFGKVSAS